MISFDTATNTLKVVNIYKMDEIGYHNINMIDMNSYVFGFGGINHTGVPNPSIISFERISKCHMSCFAHLGHGQCKQDKCYCTQG